MCALAYARAQKLPLFSGTNSRTFLQDIYLYTDNFLFFDFFRCLYRDRYLQERLGREPLRRFQDVFWSLLFQILYLFYSCCLLSLRDFIFCIQNPDIESYIDKSATTWLLLGDRSLRSLSSYLFLLFFMVILSPFFFSSSCLISTFFFIFYCFFSILQSALGRSGLKALSGSRRSARQVNLRRGVLKDLGYSLL